MIRDPRPPRACPAPAGCYLPLTAALGGRLFLRPEGFQEAARDVIRLSPDISVMLTQQVGRRGRGRGVVKRGCRCALWPSQH